MQWDFHHGLLDRSAIEGILPHLDREEIGRLRTTWMATRDQYFRHYLSDGTGL